MNTTYPKVIFEIANNHQGDRQHFKLILEKLAEVTKDYSFDFFIKFGYRDLNQFIHKSLEYQKMTGNTLIKRLLDTKLSFSEYAEMREEIRAFGFGAICTPFDEISVEQIVKQDFDYLKIASASINDWPLLIKVAETSLPVIASTGGVSLEQLDETIKFFKKKNVNFQLMHCVSLYPTPLDALQLNKIDVLRDRYPDIPIGYSSHVNPNDNLSTIIAIAKGAMFLERHVGTQTNQHKLNDYSLDMDQVSDWLRTIKKTVDISEVRPYYLQEEKVKIHTLARGFFARKDILQSQKINLDDVYISFPLTEGHLLTSEYFNIKDGNLIASKDIHKNQALTENNVTR